MGAWIEIVYPTEDMYDVLVAPLVGAWIEMYRCLVWILDRKVAPLVGAWIEIKCRINFGARKRVAPLVGAWIEICLYCRHRRRDQSLPSWEHGCKCRPKSDWHYAESQIVPFFLKIRQFPGFSVKLCTS